LSRGDASHAAVDVITLGRATAGGRRVRASDAGVRIRIDTVRNRAVRGSAFRP
jgi:hypothetical protein